MTAPTLEAEHAAPAVDIEKLKALALAATDDSKTVNEWRDALSTFSDAMRQVSPATVLELIAEVERLRARFEYIEDHATTQGGGNGFTITCFVPVDHEDIGCGIDAAIEKEKA